ncbi:UNVERIFIED_CONTAM: hypothetical protein RMT77_006426 [Armadillidium vulgare]
MAVCRNLWIYIIAFELISSSLTSSESNFIKPLLEDNENSNVTYNMNHLNAIYDWTKDVLKIINKKNEVNPRYLQSNGRFMNLNSFQTASNSQYDLLFDVIRHAVEDFGNIFESLADKYESFVERDKNNILANQVGARRLNDMLTSFQTRAIQMVNSALGFVNRMNCVEVCNLIGCPGQPTPCPGSCRVICNK